MLQLKRLSPDFAISGQIDTHVVTMVHSLGFRSVMCNRPDGEEPDQELFEDVQMMARYAGLEARYVPVKSLPPTEKELAAFIQAYEELSKPIFAYGHTGVRCEALYNAMLAQTAGGDS